MIFAHGFGCDQNMWRLVTPAFQASHRVVLFDHVGAGKSDISAYDVNKYATLDGYATDVLEICREHQLSDVIFVGHSVSAMIGVLAARREPERFKALILIGPSPRYIDDGDYVGGFSRQDIEGLLGSLDSNYLGWSTSMAPVIMVPAALIGDPVAIRQILSNLVGNAIKFTDTGSVTVTVDTKELGTDAATLTCAVSDTGIGIAPDVIDRIFNEFTQASYETAIKFGGSGLGLTITRRLLALYGSTVQVRSVPEEGSTFSFDLRLPLPRP
jgi:signal transduction histidine kinase